MEIKDIHSALAKLVEQARADASYSKIARLADISFDQAQAIKDKGSTRTKKGASTRSLLSFSQYDKVFRALGYILNITLKDEADNPIESCEITKIRGLMAKYAQSRIHYRDGNLNTDYAFLARIARYNKDEGVHLSATPPEEVSEPKKSYAATLALLSRFLTIKKMRVEFSISRIQSGSPLPASDEKFDDNAHSSNPICSITTKK